MKQIRVEGISNTLNQTEGRDRRHRAHSYRNTVFKYQREKKKWARLQCPGILRFQTKMLWNGRRKWDIQRHREPIQWLTAENFSDLEKEINIQTGEAFRIPNRHGQETLSMTDYRQYTNAKQKSCLAQAQYAQLGTHVEFWVEAGVSGSNKGK